MKKYILFLLIILGGFTINAQETIRGKVISSGDNAPLPGASVKIKGENRVVLADADGLFSIVAASSKPVLEVSFVGFKKKEISLQLQPVQPVIIRLEQSAEALQEVTVSTGYEHLPKERATGSFTYLSSATLNQQTGTSILTRLEAVANGLTADRQTASGRLMIRGLSTIRGPKDPLIILDNFPYDGDLNNINPNDVEDITILKDAAAASIWGARAGNGVIVISTKKGRFNQPLNISFNSNVTVGDKPDLFYLKQMSASDFIDVEQMLYDKGYYRSQINSSAKPALSPVVELLIRKGTASPEDAAAIDARINELRGVDVRNDFNEYIYQKALNQQYSLGMRGGSGIVAWNASSGYDKNISTLDAEYSRLNLRFQNAVKPLKNVELSAGIFYTLSKSGSGKPAYGEVTSKNGNLFPYAELADANGNALPVIKDYRQAYLQTAGNGKLLDWYYYPLEDYKHVKNTGTIQDVVINSGVSWRAVPGLTASVNYQYERQQNKGNNLQDEQSYFARDFVNRFTQINSSGAVVYKIPKGGILDLTEQAVVSHNVRGQLNFGHTWEKHSLNVMAGGEIRQAHSTQNNSRIYGYNDDILTFGTVDYTITYPQFISGSSFIPDKTYVSDQLIRYVSAYANASYVYNNRYTFSLSGRRDASNLFGVNVNNKWNPLWSAGFSWNVSDEPFYSVGFLPYLKLRVTNGFSGNTDQSMAAVTTIRYVTNSQFTLTPYSEFDNYYNPELKWETSQITNFGLDFRTKGSRLSGSIEYYRKKGKDLFGTYPLDYTSGIGATIVKNVAAMKGHGWDIELNSLNVNGRIKWTSNLNLSFYKDKVTEYYLTSTQGSRFVTSSNSISGLEGKPVYSMFSYRWAGLDPETGEARGYQNGEISKSYSALTGSTVLVDDLDYYGPVLPTTFGSLGNTVSWKNLSVTARLMYKFGHYFRRETIAYNDLYANWKGHSDFSKRWQKPGDELHTDIPALIYPASSSLQTFYTGASPFVEKADHIRLQYINLGYMLTRQSVPRLPFANLQLYMTISNLGLLWRANKQGIDPEYISSLSIPPSKSIAFGVKADL